MTILRRKMEKLMLSSIVCGVFFTNEGIEDRIKKFNPLFSLKLGLATNGELVSYSAEKGISILAQQFLRSLLFLNHHAGVRLISIFVN